MDTGGVEWLQCVPPLEKALNSCVSVHVYQLVSGRVRCGHTDSLEYMLYGSTQYVAVVSTGSAPVVCPPVLRAVCVVRRLPAGKSLLIWVLRLRASDRLQVLQGVSMFLPRGQCGEPVVPQRERCSGVF